MLTDEERKEIASRVFANYAGEGSLMMFAERVERAVLEKALAQQERLHKEWSELWSPIDEAVRPLTPTGESVAAKALELINTAKAMPIPKQEPVAYIKRNESGDEIVITKSHLDSLDEGTKWIRKLWEDADPLYRDPQPAQAAAIPKQEPVCEVVQINQDRYLSLTCVGAVKPKVGDKLYASPIPAQQSPAVAVPDGWKLVPEHLDSTMRDVGCAVRITCGFDSEDERIFTTCNKSEIQRLWDVILSASPEPPAIQSPCTTEQDMLPAGYREEWKRNVMLMWSCVRRHDSSIPSDVLDYMREQLLDKLNGVHHE